MKNKIYCIECGKKVDKKSDCINVCSKCLYGEDELNQPKTEDHAHHTNCPLERK